MRLSGSNRGSFRPRLMFVCGEKESLISPFLPAVEKRRIVKHYELDGCIRYRDKCSLIRIKATQTDLPNDKATQTYNFDDETKVLGGSSKSFKSKLITKAEAFTYDPDLYDDDDDDDDDDKKDEYIDKYRKKLFMLMRIIEFMLRTGFSIGQIVAHLTYHTT